MDVTEPQLTIALQEAFTCYLAFLSHTQKLRESSLPRQGKGIETTADVSTQQYYQSRVAGIETCLRYTGKIARRVRNWVNYPAEQDNDEGITAEAEVVSFEPFLPDGQELPYLDFFSGCLVQPITPFSAGPSNSNGEATAKDIDGEPHYQQESHPRPSVSVQDTDEDEDEDEDEEEDEEDVPDIRGRRPNINTTSRTSLGIHPNGPISVTSKPSGQFYCAPSSIAPSTDQTTPASSSKSTTETEDETSDDESGEEDESSEEEDDEADESDSDGSQDDESDESDSEDEDDTDSVTSEMAAAFYLPKIRDIDNPEYANRTHTMETKQANEKDRSLAQAKRLAEQWAREEEARLRQQKCAEELERQEREKQEKVKRDREATLKAQKEQERWELEAIARETAAMRAEERQRREEAEARRLAEQERRARIERERRLAEEIKQRNQAHAEERRRRDAEEAQRRRREREKQEKMVQIDCLACMEPGDRKDMVVLSCRHAYCGECIKEAFKTAYKSRTPFRCCGVTISTKTSHIPRYLSPSLAQKYNYLLLELSTPQPKYCSSPSCSRFLPPNLYHAPIITCSKCRTRTCTLCTQPEHAGVCKQDKDGIRVEKLAKRKGWKQCPSCSQVVEKTEGCLHITCRCGAEWCYACLREWGVCGSACARSTRMGEGAGIGVGGRAEPIGVGGRAGPNGAARVIPLVATAVLWAILSDP